LLEIREFTSAFLKGNYNKVVFKNLISIICRGKYLVENLVNVLVFNFQIDNFTGRLKFIIVKETIINPLINDIKNISDRLTKD